MLKPASQQVWAVQRPKWRAKPPFWVTRSHTHGAMPVDCAMSASIQHWPKQRLCLIQGRQIPQPYLINTQPRSMSRDGQRRFQLAGPSQQWHPQHPHTDFIFLINDTEPLPLHAQQLSVQLRPVGQCVRRQRPQRLTGKALPLYLKSNFRYQPLWR